MRRRRRLEAGSRWLHAGLVAGMGYGVPACTDPNEAEADTGSGIASDAGTDASGGTPGSSGMTSTDGVGAACPDPEGAVAGIMADACSQAGCHGMTAAAGLDLSGSDWQSRLIGVASLQCTDWIRVVPGDPASSLLYDKVAGSPACGSAMPVGSMLSDADVACIAAWIESLPAMGCETCGGASCIDTQTSRAHCGDCDAPCPAGVACEGGTCACPGTSRACAEACVDTQTDGQHCGGCDSPCGDEFCLDGECVADCGALTQCNGGCVDTTSNALHCGGCDSPCPQGSTCVESTCTCPGEAVGYVATIEPIFTGNCATMGCHGFPLPKEGLDLRSGQGYARLVGVTSQQCGGVLVDPGAPDNSYLLDKLRGADLCPSTMQMPVGGSLSSSDIALVSAWICHGALP